MNLNFGDRLRNSQFEFRCLSRKFPARGILALLAPALLLAQTTWKLPPQFRSAGYTREFRDGALVLAGPGPSAALAQVFSAAPWRGQAVRLKAAIRVEGGGTAQLLLRVDRPDGELAFFDNMGDRPIRSGEWATYTVEGEVASDAVTIETGVLSSGKAAVFLKDLAFEKIANTSGPAAETLRANYARVDAAFAAGDAAAITALALPDAEIVLPSGPIRLASQKFVPLRSKTTVTRVRTDGDEATVWTNNETVANEQGVLSSNRDLWVRVAGAWKLKRSTLIATRPLTPPDVLAGIRANAGMPDLRNVRVLLWQGAEPAPIPGFTPVPIDQLDPRFADQSAARAVDYLKEHAPEEAGPALLAFQGTDPARVAAIVRVFEKHREASSDWAYARHAALLVYQSKTLAGRPEEAIAANLIWCASEALPDAKILAAIPNAAAVAPLVRSRYGRQVYTVGAIARELLGGDYFLDLSRVPPDTPLARWVAAQKFPFDAIAAGGV